MARRLYRYVKCTALQTLPPDQSKLKAQGPNWQWHTVVWANLTYETNLIVISPVETCGTESFSVELFLGLPVWAVGSSLRPLHRLARNVVEKRLSLVVGCGAAVLAVKLSLSNNKTASALE